MAQTGARARLSFAERILTFAAGGIKSIDVSDCGLSDLRIETCESGLNVESAELQLHRFPSLQHVNMSGNPYLGSAGVTAILSSLAGAWHRQAHARG